MTNQSGREKNKDYEQSINYKSDIYILQSNTLQHIQNHICSYIFTIQCTVIHNIKSAFDNMKYK